MPGKSAAQRKAAGADVNRIRKGQTPKRFKTLKVAREFARKKK